MATAINKLNDALLTFSESADALFEAWSAVEMDAESSVKTRVLEMLHDNYPLGDNLRDLKEAIAVWQTNVLIASKSFPPKEFYEASEK